MEDKAKAANPVLIRVNDKEFSFTETVVIGRGSDCGLQIPDNWVSRKHATLEFDGEDWTIKDLGSANGTYVNGVKIEKEKLLGTCQVQLGGQGPAISVVVPQKPVPEEKPAAATFSSEDQIIEHYFSKKKGEEVGDQTMMFMRAFESVHKKRSRKYVVIVAVAVLLLAVSGGFIFYQKSQIAKLRSAAENIFYAMKSIELQIARIEDVMLSKADKDQMGELASKRTKLKEMAKDYDNFVKDLGVYKKLSDQDRIIFRMARVFGECDINIPESFLQEVKAYMGKWKATDRLRTALALAKSKGYVAPIEKVMTHYNLPPHYFFLALQESGFNDRAVGPNTRYGYAKGMWQFITLTAHTYGLEPGPLYETPSYDPLDDRFNVEKATGAAGRYLRDLNTSEAQASGLLVLASYNWGEGNIIPTIQKMPPNPRERNFWKLLARKDIPKETYDYVFYIFSASVICQDPRLFGFDNIDCPVFNTK
jgi:membrane-bound lytic murein transglycosylase D